MNAEKAIKLLEKIRDINTDWLVGSVSSDTLALDVVQVIASDAQAYTNYLLERNAEITEALAELKGE